MRFLKLFVSLCVCLFVLTTVSIQALADYPHPGGDGGGGGYVRGFPSCPVEYTGSYYYVSKNGSRFTPLVSNLDQVLDQQQDLLNSRVCDYSGRPPGLCQVSYTGSYYYVTRNSTRITALTSNIQESQHSLEALLNTGNCETSYYGPQDECSVEYTGSYYYVAKNNQRYSQLYSNYFEAINFYGNSINSGMCTESRAQNTCNLEFTGSYYYVSRNQSRFSDLRSDLNQALNDQWSFIHDRLCDSPRSYARCSIEYTGSYYYVAREGSRISALFSQVNQAQGVLRALQQANSCY